MNMGAESVGAVVPLSEYLKEKDPWNLTFSSRSSVLLKSFSSSPGNPMMISVESAMVGLAATSFSTFPI
jgi:hypothetical protein